MYMWEREDSALDERRKVEFSAMLESSYEMNGIRCAGGIIDQEYVKWH